jgi:chaperonin cofactor prefoldin
VAKKGQESEPEPEADESEETLTGRIDSLEEWREKLGEYLEEVRTKVGKWVNLKLPPPPK